MTKSEIAEKVQEINDAAYALYRQIGNKHDDIDLNVAANLLYSVSDILDAVYDLTSE